MAARALSHLAAGIHSFPCPFPLTRHLCSSRSCVTVNSLSLLDIHVGRRVVAGRIKTEAEEPEASEMKGARRDLAARFASIDYSWMPT